jgi:hypothetical protein
LVPNGYIVKIDGDRFWYATGRPGAGKFLLTRAELLAGEIAAFVGRPSRNIALNAISIPLFEDE